LPPQPEHLLACIYPPAEAMAPPTSTGQSPAPSPHTREAMKCWGWTCGFCWLALPRRARPCLPHSQSIYMPASPHRQGMYASGQCRKR